MKCQHCMDEVKEFDKTRKAHITLFKNANDGHIHIHGDLSNKEIAKELLMTGAEEIGLDLHKQTVDKKEIIFHNRQRIGDILMFTCGVRDFKKAFPDVKVNVISTASHIWDHNPNIDRKVSQNGDNTVKIGPSKLTNASNRIDWHFSNAFRISIEDTLGVKIPQGESRADVYFSEEEYNEERVIKEPYWVICVNGEKGWGCKMFPFDKWQEFVSSNPDTRFVQIGTKEDNPPRLRGDNVIDHVGKTQDKETGVRDIFKLFLNAEGSIGLVSFHMHLSGALYKPCIVVAGAREPVSFTRYAGHQYLATDGCLPCATKACWHCGIDSCTNLKIVKEEKVPMCVHMIEPDDLTRALNNYYKGGLLDKNKPSDKPPIRKTLGEGYGVNVVKAPPTIKIKEISVKDMYGLDWNGAHIQKKDWDYIVAVMERYGCKSVLEFGAGLSTFLFNDICNKVVTYEDQQRWIDRTIEKKSGMDVRLWDGKSIDIDEEFDLAFVDGPSGGNNRENSIKIASEKARVVIVHDAYGEWEKKWQSKHMEGWFETPDKMFGRCRLWTRARKKVPESKKVPEKVVSEQSSPKKTKFVKIVSTARGWGGCARSVTTIMDLLIKKGHKVEFIPFRNSVGSNEFREVLDDDLKGVKVTLDYSTVKEKCDVFFMYADDYVWEFDKPEIQEAFSEINAERKVMMVNYRRGKVGEIEWTKLWDCYMFLNHDQSDEFAKIHHRVSRRVLPPCTILEPFFEMKPNYNTNLRIVRHSSQGDTKFYKGYENDVNKALELRKDLELSFLPGPSFVQPTERIKKQSRTADPKVIAQFLSEGNLFWYSLPQGYMDMGPRVIIEAMAVGLPVIADNWGGARSRLTDETGWLCDNKEQHLEIIKNVTVAELEKKGQAAREKAFNEFRPEKWIKEILG